MDSDLIGIFLRVGVVFFFIEVLVFGLSRGYCGRVFGVVLYMC